MQKRKFYFLISLFLSLIFLFFYKDSNKTISFKKLNEQNLSQKQDLETSLVKSLKKNPLIYKAQSSKVKSEARNQEIKQPLGTDPHQKKKEIDYKNEIRFKVVNGYAVSSEDILIGKAKKTSQTILSSPFSEQVKLWPLGEVHFALHKDFHENERKKIFDALKEFENKTDIRFIAYDERQRDVLFFSPSKDLCASFVGRAGGVQPLFISPNCELPQIKHEVMHALGFIHEHQREDRNIFVNIVYENIIPDKIINFDILPTGYQKIYKGLTNHFDYQSLMIYPPEAFSKVKGDKTILTNSKDFKIEPRDDLSETDIQKINEVYFRKL